MNHSKRRSMAIGALLLAAAAQAAAAEITFYENRDFRGRAFSTEGPVADLSRRGFNDRASSVVVESGRWEVCEDARYGGQCTVLRRGNYDSLERMGLNNEISSVRPIERGAMRGRQEREPMYEPAYEYRRRPEERLYEAPVTSVRAVVGPPEQQCWIDREQVTEESRSKPNVGGAIAGAIIGGILGHQIGSGRGNDVATAGGAIAGGAVGANVGRGGPSTTTYDRDVRRCENVVSRDPQYWDVTYQYRGVEHHVQMSSPPGRTIVVNSDGVPRA